MLGVSWGPGVNGKLDTIYAVTSRFVHETSSFTFYMFSFGLNFEFDH